MKDDERSGLERRLERWTRSGPFAESSLLRLLIHETWFRVAFIGFLGLLLFLALFLPKIWSNAPKGFHTDLPVSGLDYLQAWAQKRTALKAMAANRPEEAMLAWRGALANTPGNPEISRGMLRFLLSTETKKEFLGHAYYRAGWLLELTRTNRADVALVASVYEKYQLYEPLLVLLKPFENDLDEARESSYLKALFRTGRVEAFAQRLERSGPKRPQDPELPLYEAAYLAGWGPADRREAAQRKLSEALDVVSLRYLACRLLLAVGRQTENLPQFEQALDRLYEWRVDTSADHANHWRFLSGLNRKAEAIARARKNYGYPPGSASDAIELAKGYLELGLPDLAEPMLKRFAGEFGFSEGYWEVYANLLIERKKWQEILEVAIRMRQQPMIRDTLSVYSFYLEGLALASLKRGPMAEAAFGRLAAYRLTNGPLALSLAAKIDRIGYPGPARQLLLNHRHDRDERGRELTAEASYWRLMFQLALQLKLPEQMLEAATKTHEMLPGDRTALNNYAATLLALRQKPLEALRATAQLWDGNIDPRHYGPRINHCLALLLNHRTLDARDFLLAVDPKRLTGNELPAFNLAWFEISANLEQWDEARDFAGKLGTNSLLPSQLEWVQERLSRFPAKSPPPA